MLCSTQDQSVHALCLLAHVAVGLMLALRSVQRVDYAILAHHCVLLGPVLWSVVDLRAPEAMTGVFALLVGWF